MIILALLCKSNTPVKNASARVNANWKLAVVVVSVVPLLLPPVLHHQYQHSQYRCVTSLHQSSLFSALTVGAFSSLLRSFVFMEAPLFECRGCLLLGAPIF
jgi:hypothetical protein